MTRNIILVLFLVSYIFLKFYFNKHWFDRNFSVFHCRFSPIRSGDYMHELFTISPVWNWFQKKDVIGKRPINKELLCIIWRW